MKLNRLLFLVFFVSMGFFSCKKTSYSNMDKEYANISNENNNISNLRTSNIAVEYKYDMLIFADIEAFNQTVRDLEQLIDEWNLSFLNAHPNINIEELDSIADLEGFNENQPLMDFESQFQGYQSLRNFIEQQELIWLNNSELDINNDPDNHLIIEETVRTLINSLGEVMIGSSIYKFYNESQLMVEITDADIATLIKLRNLGNNPAGLASQSNVVIIHFGGGGSGGGGGNGSSVCRSNKRDFGYEEANNKKIKCVVSHWTYPWGRYAIAKTSNYKKKNGKWKKYKTNCTAKVYGYISDTSGDCSSQIDFNPYNAYKQATSKKVKHKIAVSTKTKSGWIKAYHEGAGGITYNSTLTW